MHIGDRDNRGHYWTVTAGAIRAGGLSIASINGRAATITGRRRGDLL
nr:hypothetical protein [Serratia sp. 1D1416]